MLALLRIALAVGLIFWFSPARRPVEVPLAGAADLDRIGQMIEAWEKLPPDARAAALHAAGSPLKSARKPGG
ncbi:MAG TPA: hypothetical protein VF744_14950 [Beijerinckiaceae bacterium]|jgi:hypothetical protein